MFYFTRHRWPGSERPVAGLTLHRRRATMNFHRRLAFHARVSPKPLLIIASGQRSRWHFDTRCQYVPLRAA